MHITQDIEIGSTHIVTVERMSYGSAAIAHLACGMCVFVEGAVWGDVCEIVIDTVSKHFARAHLLRILEASELRCSSPYPESELAGSAPWAQLIYEAQLSSKRACVKDALVRGAHLPQDLAERLVEEVVPAKHTWNYRNKIELSAFQRHNQMYLGMFDGMKKDFVPIKTNPLGNTLVQDACKRAIGAVQFIARSQDIALERIGIRASVRTKSLEVSLWTRPEAFPRGYVAKMLNSAIPQATSITRVITKGAARTRKVVRVERLSGEGCWHEKLRDHDMYISSPSFFQVHTHAAEKLIEDVLKKLAPTSQDTVMDLYCGAGTFTLPLAQRAKKVVGVEAQGMSIQDLKRHIKRGKYHNIEAICGDANREFPRLKADLVVVDPPRAGLEAQVIEKLSDQPARAIAYVSCDPVTLARDIRRFIDRGIFYPEVITPHDLFPQSYHVETVVLMSRAD